MAQTVASIFPVCRCAMIINHYYKFIYIRNRKAASTTIRRALDKKCDGGRNRQVRERTHARGHVLSHSHPKLSIGTCARAHKGILTITWYGARLIGEYGDPLQK